MFIKKLSNVLPQSFVHVLIGVMVSMPAALSSGVAQAGDLALANLPLYLGQTTPANILFLMDDSGSMDWEVMSRDLANGGKFTANQPDGTDVSSAGAVVHRSGCGFPYTDVAGTGCDTAARESWRFRNKDFNTLYYDPNQTYTPWAGLRKDGTAFADVPITAAPNNPYDPGTTVDLTENNCPSTTTTTTQTVVVGTKQVCTKWRNGKCKRWKTVDITQTVTTTTTTRDGFRYYDWTDDGDGVFENGEETEHVVCDLTAAQKTNFANWFSYYRSREHAAKAAYGKVIAQGRNVRMGLVSIHNNNSVNTAIADMNDDPTTGNKLALMGQLYNFNSSGGTPLRSMMNECGKYLSCDTNSLFSSCPALTSAKGGNCQQNFLIMMTDGLWNGSFSGPAKVNADGDNNTKWDGGSHADNWDSTLGDVAMHFYENDIHTGLPNELPILLGVDENTAQHVVTFSVAFGVDGNISAMPPDRTSAFAWPQPSKNTAATVDDLRHAAWNGRGVFLSAKNPQDLTDSLLAALASIGQRTSSAASAAVNTGTLSTNSQIYQARFNSTDWSGQFLAFAINLDGSIGKALGDAATLLDGQHWLNGREILTTSGGKGVGFVWVNLSTAEQDALRKNPKTGATETVAVGQARLNFIRGDRSNEAPSGLGFRKRSTTLGDLVHSSPVFIGPGTIFNYPDNLEGSTTAASYFNFITNTILKRDSMVYVGGNDGMLHGFDGTKGHERIAYIPGTLLTGLNELTNPNYLHRFYVDGEISYRDVYFGGKWHTVLIGALRHGGQGFYALDVTDPAAYANAESSPNPAKVVMWEFTDATDNGVDTTGYPDLGYSYSRPAIVKLNDGRWAALFGNGYNATEADGHASTDGDAVLFVVNVADGKLIQTISTKTGIAEDPTAGARPNGLASPAVVDINGDFESDLVYAGDLFGNLWKFDISDTDPTKWKVALKDVNSNPAPLFKAEIDMSLTSTKDIRPQPITTRPEVSFHPYDEGMLVYFGTGQYIENGDHSTTNQTTQTFYSVWDDYTNTVAGRSKLLQQEIVQEVVFKNTAPKQDYDLRLSTAREIDWTTHKGWYMDLYNTDEGKAKITDNKGERQVSDSILRAGRIIFTTIQPVADVCGFGGTGWLMEMDAFSGARLGETPFDVNEDGSFTKSDNIKATVAIDDDGDGKLDGGGTTTVDEAASGKKSKQGMLPRVTIVAGGTNKSGQDQVFKYGSGTMGGIDVTTESEGSLSKGRTSWFLR